MIYLGIFRLIFFSLAHVNKTYHVAILYAGQVHRARLKGEELVVKVQRPGLKDLFDIDLKNLRVGSKSPKL